MTPTHNEAQEAAQLMISTLAMPADTNADGDIFGGWVLGQMDIAGAILAKRLAKGRTVTVGVEAMRFHRPVYIGDLLQCYCKVIKTGRTSIQIHVESWALRAYKETKEKVTEGYFTYVAIDQERRPKELNEKLHN